MVRLLRKIGAFLTSFTLTLILILAIIYFQKPNQISSRKVFGLNPTTIAKATTILPQRELWLRQKLAKMTLEEKVAQMFIFRAEGTSMTEKFETFLKKIKPGGVILMGDNISDGLSQFTGTIQKTNSEVPLFISIDQEGGLVKRIKSDPNPGGKALSKASPEIFCSNYQNTAELLKKNGVNVNFNTVADLGINKKSFIYERTFEGDPNQVATLVGKQLDCSPATLNTLKHFPGHGRTEVDSHKEIPVIDIDYATWQSSDAIPFAQNINKYPDFIMMGHLNFKQIDNQPATLSAIQVENLRKLGFEGIIITDAMEMLVAAGMDPIDSLIRAVKAGNDVILYVSSPLDPEILVNKIIELVKSGEISLGRIEKSVERILRAKFKIKD
jgi:beta-N-acetylhexosaminidase